MSVIVSGFDLADNEPYWWGFERTSKGATGYVDPDARADFFDELRIAYLAYRAANPAGIVINGRTNNRVNGAWVLDSATGSVVYSTSWGLSWVYAGTDPAMSVSIRCCESYGTVALSTNLGCSASNSAPTSISLGIGSDVSVGSTIIVVYGGNKVPTGCTDAAGNTYVADALKENVGKGAAAIYRARITHAMAAGQQITVSHPTDSVAGKAITARAFTNLAASQSPIVHAGVSGFGSSVTLPSVAGGDVCVAALGVLRTGGGTDSASVPADFSQIGQCEVDTGAAFGAALVAGDYREGHVTGDVGWSLSAARDYAAIAATYSV